MGHSSRKSLFIAVFAALLLSSQAQLALAAPGGDSFDSVDSVAKSPSSNNADGQSSMNYFEDMGGREGRRPLTFMLRLNSEESLVEGSAPSMGVGGGVQYDFGKSYAVGTEFSYKRPFTQFENYSFNGGDDLAFYFSDRELYVSPHHDFVVNYKLSGILPTSQRSATQTMLGGFSEEIGARENFGRHWSLGYSVTLGELFYQYDSSNAPTPNPLYNSPFVYANKLTLTYKWTRSFKIQLGSGIKSKTDYQGATSSTYNVSSGITYEVTRDFSFDFGIRSSVKDTGPGGGGGKSEEEPGSQASGGGGGNEPKTGDTLFDPGGTAVYLGTILRI
jgi:hypothetical protein